MNTLSFLRAATLLVLLFFTFCLFSQPTWNYFAPASRLVSVAARGNDVLVCSNFNFGFYHLDTLGNAAHYTIYNGGVPFTFINCVGVDAEGGWWVAHEAGVSRYNGSDWTSWSFTGMGLPPSGTSILAFETLDDGRVFVLTNNAGLALYENGAWSLLNTGNSGLPSNTVRDITTDSNGKTLFATSSGLAVTDGNQWTVHTSSSTGISQFNNCTGVVVDADGILWATAGLNRLAHFENGVWTSYNAAALGMPNSLGLTGDLVFDQQGRLWMAYSKGVAVRQDSMWTYTSDTLLGCSASLAQAALNNRLAVDGSGRVWSTLCDLQWFTGPTEPVSMPYTNVYFPTDQLFSITQDTSGVMWFAGEGGLAGKDGDTWQLYKPEDLGLMSNGVYTAHGDAHGNVWFGGDFGAILRYDGSNWTVFDTISEVFPGFWSYWSIASAPDGTVWFSIVPPAAFSARLARFQNGNWSFFDPNNAPLPNNMDITAIVVDDDGTAWFLAHDRLLRYDGSNWTSFDPMDAGLDYNILRRMTLGPDGALWISSDAGVLRFDGAAWSTLSTSNSDIPTNDIYPLAFDALGGMYLGYDPSATLPNLGILNNGAWTSLLPPGFEPGFYARPWVLFTDRDDRLWYSLWQYPGIFMYDPMLSSAAAAPQSAATELRVYPNPATDAITVAWDDPSTAAVRIRLLDLSGTSVWENSPSYMPEQVTLSLPQALPAGLYVVEVTGADGRRRTARLVRM